MKIALVSPYDYVYPGGVNAHISHLKDQFIEMGHDIMVIAPSSKPEETRQLGNVMPIGKPFSIPASGSIARIALSLRLSPKVKTILADEQFDIVHLHEPLVPLLPITVLRFSQSINVGTFHAYHGSNRGYRYGRRLLKRWFRKLDGKIAVSNPAMTFISKYFPGYYNIIPNGIDVEHFSSNVAPIEEYCDGKLNLLFVGRLEKRKGLDYLLKAYRRVKGEFPNSRLIAVGPGTRLRHGYERWVTENNVKDVVFVGFVPYEELPRYYKTADVFCAPATGKESFGVVLLEAMAAAKPIVASNIEGYASVVTHGVEGLLVEPKEEETLAISLVHLLADESLRQEMGARGRAKVGDYSWKHIAHKVMDYYERLLSETPSQASPEE